MPGHRAAFAGHVKADGKLAPEELRCCGIVHEREIYRIAPDRQTRGYSGRARPGEADRLVAGRGECGGGPLQADIDAIKGDRPCPQRVRKPEPHLPSLEIGSNDQTKVLVASATLCRRKRKP